MAGSTAGGVTPLARTHTTMEQAGPTLFPGLVLAILLEERDGRLEVRGEILQLPCHGREAKKK